MGKEGRKRGPRIAIASLAGTAGVTAAQRKWQRRNEPPPQWVGGLHRERPKGVATVEFFSLLSESMTQCVFLFNRAGTFFGASDSAKGLGKYATIKQGLKEHSISKKLHA